MNDTVETSTSPKVLTDSQKARIERNRQKALLLRQSRVASSELASNPIVSRQENSVSSNTGGGFFLDPDDPTETSLKDGGKVIVHPAPSILPNEQPTCEECQKKFGDSFLFTHYDYPVCDGCRDKQDKHSLITKTDALKEYLLKNCDLEMREPVLRYILKKNPHANRGDMKLFLRCQVYKRALEVWETEDALEEAHDKREDDRGKRKQKAYNKKVKTLRMEVRSSLYRMDRQTHEHVYGEEKYDEDEDVYIKTCRTCPHTLSYEKM